MHTYEIDNHLADLLLRLALAPRNGSRPHLPIERGEQETAWRLCLPSQGPTTREAAPTQPGLALSHTNFHPSRIPP